VRSFAQFLDEVEAVWRELEDGRWIHVPGPPSQVDAAHLRHRVAAVSTAPLQTDARPSAVQVARVGGRRQWRRAGGHSERFERRGRGLDRSVPPRSAVTSSRGRVRVGYGVRRRVRVREILCAHHAAAYHSQHSKQEHRPSQRNRATHYFSFKILSTDAKLHEKSYFKRLVVCKIVAQLRFGLRTAWQYKLVYMNSWVIGAIPWVDSSDNKRPCMDAERQTHSSLRQKQYCDSRTPTVSTSL